MLKRLDELDAGTPAPRRREDRQAIALAAGLARWKQVPAEKRSEAARKAVRARWAKAKKAKGKTFPVTAVAER